MRRNTDAATKIVLNWKLEGKRSRGRPGRSWNTESERDSIESRQVE